MEATVRKSTANSPMRRSLDEIVESYDDAAVYRYLQQTDPEGMEMVSDEEKNIFLKELGVRPNV